MSLCRSCFGGGHIFISFALIAGYAALGDIYAGNGSGIVDDNFSRGFDSIVIFYQ